MSELGCLECGAEYGGPWFPDMIIPDSAWLRIMPTLGGLLCPTCILARLHEEGLECVPCSFTSGPCRSVSELELCEIRMKENNEKKD